MTLRELENGFHSVVTCLADAEFESTPLRDVGEANLLQAKVTTDLRLLSLARSDPHVTDLLSLLVAGERPSKSRLMMAVAHLMALRSTCARLRVGCVVTNHLMTTIYSVGYNGQHAGGPNTCDTLAPGICGCLHAEDNALVKLRTEAHDLFLFTTHAPCAPCARRIINQGNIIKVLYDLRYRDPAGLEILTDRVAARCLADDE